MEALEEKLVKEEIVTRGPVDFWRQGVIRLLLFFLFLGLVTFGVDQTLSYGLRRITTSRFGAINAWMSGNVNTQVIINGSSRALVHYDPRIISRETGLSAYNLGANGVQIDVQAGILDAYLARNQAPKIIIQNLEAFSFEATKSGEIYDPGIYMPHLDSPELYRALLAIDHDVWKWRHIPLYGYAVADMRFTWARGIAGLFGIQGRQDYFDGFNPRFKDWSQDFENFRKGASSGVEYKVESKGREALVRCLELARTKGALMILVYSPEYVEMQHLEKNRGEIFLHFRELAEKYGAEFWDYSDSPLCSNRDFFYNSQHLNARGAELFSEDVARRLRRFLESRKVATAPNVSQGSTGSE